MRIVTTMAMLLVLAAGAPAAGAAEKSVKAPADIERLIKRMEDSGALDAAIDRGIERHIRRQVEARQKQQEELKKRQDLAAKGARAVDSARDHVYGNEQAEVSVIVYTDLECPYCKRFAGTPEQAIATYNGKANVVFRHYPLDFHGEIAKRGAYFAECVARQAGAKGFFAFANDWFRLTASNGKGLPRGDAQIGEIAAAAGAKDLAALNACAKDPAVAQLVQNDIVDGTRSGITGTPGVIVRNNRTGVALSVTGAVPVQALTQAIDQVLKN